MPTISLDDLDSRRLERHDPDARLRALLDAAIDAIVTIDEHGIIESVNPATERLFGYGSHEMLGSNVSMLMASPHRERHDQYLQRYLTTGERRIIGIGREVEARRRDGSVFPVDLTVTEFRIGQQRMFTGMIRDVSDRRAAQRAAEVRLEELAHAGRLADLGLTTSTIAHEVSQPLAAIVSFADACQRMLDAGNVDREVLRDALSQIAAQGERGSAIIRRIRDLARRGDSATEPVDVNAAVRDVLALLSRRLHEHQVAPELVLDRDLPRVPADRVQVEQVIMNLVGNALDAMDDVEPARRGLHIETRRDGDGIHLIVHDNGPGLAAGEAERVFESFYTTKPAGMGVGLSICRSLAEARGGRMWAESAPAGGAAFHLTLPVGPPVGS